MADEKDMERLSNSDKARTNVGGVNYSLAKREDKESDTESHETRVDIDRIKSIKPVGKVRKRQEKTGTKLLHAFFGDEVNTFGQAMDHLLYRVAIPAFKATIWEMAGAGFDSAMKRSKKKRREGYASMYDDDDRRERRDRRGSSITSVGMRDYGEVPFRTEGDALTAISILNDICEDYGYARVSDLYDIAGVSCGSAEDKWGWYPGDFSRCKPRSYRVYDEDEGRYVSEWCIDGIPEPERLRGR